MLQRVMRIGAGRTRRALDTVAREAHRRFEQQRAMSDAELVDAAGKLREEVCGGTDVEDVAVEAFALAAVAIERETGLVLRPNQFLAAAAMSAGRVAELATGEGKTLAVVPAVFLRALEGKGVHVVTANEYLAARDAEQAGRILARCSMSVGLSVSTEKALSAKQAAWGSDVTYTTAAELGFDFLRDRLALSRDVQTMRTLHAAFVDELDSILIDLARTPLIISGGNEAHAELVARCGEAAERMRAGEHYDVDRKNRDVAFTEAGAAWASEAFGAEISDPESALWVAGLHQALLAKEVYRRDHEYVVRDGAVVIVDSATGRPMAGRRWNGGVHQAVEWREGVEIQGESRTLVSTTLQRLFGSYEHLAGMTGTAKSSEAELAGIYGLEVVQIPSHRPVIRVDEPDVVHGDQRTKLSAVCALVVEEHRRGRPVLIGTGSIAESERLSKLLVGAGVDHQVLNAKEHANEAEIIAQAGRVGAVTVSTSMAGRGVDILLGGDPARLAASDPTRTAAEWAGICEAEAGAVRELGGLLVVGTTRAASRRVDDQLRGRAGRQGDPGASVFHLSLDDEILAPYLNSSLGWALRRTEGVQHKSITNAIQKAQATLEGRHARQRGELTQYDEVYAVQRETVWALREELLGADDDEIRAQVLDDAARVAAELEEGDTEMLARFGVTRPDDLIEAARARFDDIGEKGVFMARRLWLLHLDEGWVEHFERLQALRDAMALRVGRGLNPLTEWKREGFELFESFMAELTLDRLEWWCRAGIGVENGQISLTPPPALQS